jgi:hypothetical protein
VVWARGVSLSAYTKKMQKLTIKSAVRQANRSLPAVKNCFTDYSKEWGYYIVWLQDENITFILKSGWSNVKKL